MRLHYPWITFTNFVPSYLPKTHFECHFIINETIARGEALIRSWVGSWPHSAAFGNWPGCQGSEKMKKWQAHIDTWCQQLLHRSSLQVINIKGRGSYCSCSWKDYQNLYLDSWGRLNHPYESPQGEDFVTPLVTLEALKSLLWPRQYQKHTFTLEVIHSGFPQFSMVTSWIFPKASCFILP